MIAKIPHARLGAVGDISGACTIRARHLHSVRDQPCVQSLLTPSSLMQHTCEAACSLVQMVPSTLQPSLPPYLFCKAHFMMALILCRPCGVSGLSICMVHDWAANYGEQSC